MLVEMSSLPFSRYELDKQRMQNGKVLKKCHLGCFAEFAWQSSGGMCVSAQLLPQ